MSAAFVSLFLSLLLFSSTKLPKTAFVGHFLNWLANPLRQTTTIIRQTLLRQQLRFLNLSHLEKENLILKNENQALKIALKTISEEQAAARVLGQQTNFRQVAPLRLIGIGNFLTFTTADFTALKIGQPVVNGRSLLGLIVKITPPILTVMPLTHPEIGLPVQLENGARAQYRYLKDQPAISGLGSDTAYNATTLVLTLPSEMIPENLILGRIEKITSSPADPSQEAQITLDLTIADADSPVAIVKP